MADLIAADSWGHAAMISAKSESGLLLSLLSGLSEWVTLIVLVLSSIGTSEGFFEGVEVSAWIDVTSSFLAELDGP